MRCDICLSNYGGPLALCPDCLLMTYPKGLSAWVLNRLRTPVLEQREHPVLLH